MLNLKRFKEGPVSKNYKWIALSNATLAMFMVGLDGSIIMIALPAVFRGIKLDPLAAGNSSYLLWLLMGYTLVTAVLVVTLGRIGDMFGRVKMYNLGFLIFSVGSILLAITWSTGSMGAIELIAFRTVQAIGAAFLFANSAAILTDAFPPNERGMAIGINMIAAMAGVFIGMVVGGLLAEMHWRWVFLVSVPAGVAGTIWAYLALREVGIHKAAKIDWIGNLTFAGGLTMVLIALVYGIRPSGSSNMSWTTPFVLTMLLGGTALLGLFVFVERRVKDPMFQLDLFRIRAFAAGNIAGLLSSVGRGGLLFILTIWLQGIWLPLHGISFENTPFWAGICMLPSTCGFLAAGPLAGRLSDRYGARLFSTGGMVLAAVTFIMLMMLPVNFPYPVFAVALFLNGMSFGLFTVPNTTAIMNSVPAERRGEASGMRSAFYNVGTPLSTGIFFSLMVIGMNASVPTAMYNGLTQNGVTPAVAAEVAKMPPVGYLFASLLGYNPLSTLLGPKVLGSLPPDAAANITSREFFPQLISQGFHRGLVILFIFSTVICLIAAVASWGRGGKYVCAETEEKAKSAGNVRPKALPEEPV